MRPIQLGELTDLDVYERVRSEIRRRAFDLRQRRCLQLGERLSVVFENRQTILYQIQELLRAERITDETAILSEIDTYNELLPKPGHLAGTLFVEWSDPRSVREELERFAGLDRGKHLWFDLGTVGHVLSRFSEGESQEGRPSGVHRVRFPFRPEEVEAFCMSSHPVSLVVEHTNLSARVEVEGAIRTSLIEDLAEESP